MAQPIPIPFGDYQPDVAPLANEGLSVAKNTVPIRGGYGSINSLAAMSGFTVLSERPRGAAAGIDVRGNPWNFAGTETKLYYLRDSTTDVTRAAGAYNCSGDRTWEFESFEDWVFAVNLNDESQMYQLGNSTVFEEWTGPNGDAPRAAHIGILGTFVILGNIFDSDGEQPDAIRWSAVNDPFNFPTPGTDVARAVQSGRQRLSGNGGVVQRVVSGSEVAALFQERSIWRADYRGGDVVFELNRVEPDRGLLVPQIAVPFGRRVFYLAEDGFYLFDYTESTPVGDERVDRTFLADIDSSYFHRVSAVSDPDEKRIWILYPGAGNSSGTPNKLLIYDWSLNRFSHGEIDAEWLAHAVDAGVDLDSPHTAADPDTDGVDGAGLVPFDQRIAVAGSLKLGAYSTTFQLSDFSGASMAGTLETGRRSLVPNSRALANMAEAVVDNVDPTIQCAAISKANGTPKYGVPSRVNEDGMSPLRCDGRYHTFKVNLTLGWDNALGLHVWASPTGRR
jgi:hypothetical protein